MTEPTAPARFVADCMLGRLAKWLRVLGYDVAYERRIDDDALIELARRDRRILLSRDTRLARRRALKDGKVLCILVESDRPDEQLAEMIARHGVEIRPRLLLSRCLRCNEPTVAATRDDVRDEVPPYVHGTQRRFSRCPACRRVYWRATHVDGILARLRRRLPAALLDTPRDGR